MKKIMLITAMLFTLSITNAEDKVVTFTQIPQSAQEFTNANFKGEKIASAQMETSLFGAITDGYKVVFTDGTEIEFDSDGNWEEISAKTSSVPSDLIPEKITKYIKDNFGGSPVVVLKKESKVFEVELATKQELKFNNNYIFIGLD